MIELTPANDDAPVYPVPLTTMFEPDSVIVAWSFCPESWILSSEAFDAFKDALTLAPGGVRAFRRIGAASKAALRSVPSTGQIAFRGAAETSNAA